MEKQYYIVENNAQLGPFTLAELKQKKINKTTLVWLIGIDDWVPAETLEDLKPIFQNSPPPIPTGNISKIIIKTEEPLQFEDTIKKKEIEQLTIKNKNSRKRTVNEIKRIAKFIKIGFTVAILVFLISFGFLDGYKFLFYYMKASENNTISVEHQRETKSIEPCYTLAEFKKKMNENNEVFNTLENWSNPLGLFYSNPHFLFDVKKLEMPIYYQRYILENQIREQSSSKYITIDAHYYYFQNKNGKPLENNAYYYRIFEPSFSLKSLIDAQIKKGEIRRKTAVAFQITVYYGKYLVDKINYALKNSLLYGLISFILIFPLSYFIFVVYSLFKNSISFIKKYATN